MLQGIELGHANDQVFAEHNSKQKGGALGSLTNGLLGRTEYYVQAVILALVPHVKNISIDLLCAISYSEHPL